MTPLEGETAVIALAVCAVTPWALFAARVWKVSTATKPKKAEQAAPDAAAEAPVPAERSLRAS
jgi:hypothetical protein